MKIELLLTPDCPNRELALQRLDEALLMLGLSDVEVTQHDVSSIEQAQERNFSGSPTYLRDGRDLFVSTDAVASISCRVYATDNGFEGAPSATALSEAIRGA
jgi:hypothetical protein